MIGSTLPNWLVQLVPVLLCCFFRNKHDSLVEKVELLDANPSSVNVRLKSGNEVTVSISVLALCPSIFIQTLEEPENIKNCTASTSNKKIPVLTSLKLPEQNAQNAQNLPGENSTPNTASSIPPVSEDVSLRRSSRIRENLFILFYFA